MNNFKKYLPSRKFLFIVLFIIVLIVLFFFVKGVISFIKNRIASKQTNETPVTLTVGGIIQKDGNANGIADWEEYLWGLNPNKDGEKNREFILSKKKALIASGDMTISDDSGTILENERLSREFFATIVSLQQSGELNAESIKSLSEAIGQKIEVTPIPDIYNENDLNVKGDGIEANRSYVEAFGKLATKYEDADIGNELILISQGLGGNDPQTLVAVRTIAIAYRSFGQDLIKIPVPNIASNIHLSIANNYEKNAQSIEGLTLMLSDPIIGMRSLLNYKKYNDALISDIEKLKEILQ